MYVANRADASVDCQGRRVFAGGENSIAVFSIDERTGEPRLVQHASTRAIHVGTFGCDPSGRLLVAGSIERHADSVGGESREVPAALSLFRIGGDGGLDFVRRYEVEVDGAQIYLALDGHRRQSGSVSVSVTKRSAPAPLREAGFTKRYCGLRMTAR